MCAQCHGLNGAALASHRQRHVLILGKCVDDGIADLVKVLNERGWSTTDSCIGRQGVALGRSYVGFANSEDALEVVEAVLVGSDDGLTDRVVGSILLPAQDRWEISMGLQLAGSRSYRLQPYLSLPRSDVELAVQLLQGNRTSSSHVQAADLGL